LKETRERGENAKGGLMAANDSVRMGGEGWRGERGDRKMEGYRAPLILLLFF